MLPISRIPPQRLAAIHTVFTDIDDTLTLDGRLPAEAYTALQRLQDAGIAVVPITGRPAGWCDMIARFWPVQGVVGENGAFYFSYRKDTRKLVQRFVADAAERRRNRLRLDALQARILREVPGTGIASDQLYREADLAIDVCEDVDPLPPAAVDRVLRIFAEAGATAKLSSIHVNGWFGEYDKLSMTRLFASDVLGLDLDAERQRMLFVGDSPNDSPMFAHFPYSCGVANIRAYEHTGIALPAFVADGHGGTGFVEIVDRLLAAKLASEAGRAVATATTGD